MLKDSSRQNYYFWLCFGSRQNNNLQTNFIFSPHIFEILHYSLYLKWIISIIFISFSLWNLFETEIAANRAILPFKNLLSINKFSENSEVFLNFSTFCWYSDFLSIVSLIISKHDIINKKSFETFSPIFRLLVPANIRTGESSPSLGWVPRRNVENPFALMDFSLFSWWIFTIKTGIPFNDKTNNVRRVIKSWILSKDVVLAVQYKVYLVKRVIWLVDTVHYSYNPQGNW